MLHTYCSSFSLHTTLILPHQPKYKYSAPVSCSSFPRTHSPSVVAIQAASRWALLPMGLQEMDRWCKDFRKQPALLPAGGREGARVWCWGDSNRLLLSHTPLLNAADSSSLPTGPHLGILLIVTEFQQQILFLLTQLPDQVLLCAGVHEVPSHLVRAWQVAPD